MSPRQQFHKRAPRPGLINLGLPLSLPTPVTQLLNPLVQVNPSSSKPSSQPPQQNPPAPQPSPQPAPQPAPPRPAPQPSPPPSSPSSSSGGNSNSGGNGSGGGSNSNDGNQSGNNGSDETNGTQGNQNGANSSGSENGGQSNSPNGSNQSSQNGVPTSTGSSNTPAKGTGQSPSQPSSGNSGHADGGGSASSSSAENGEGPSQAGGSEATTVSPVPILGDISAPSQSGGPSSQNGNINSDTTNNNTNSDSNGPSQAGKSSTSPGSGSTSNSPSGVTGNHDNGIPLSGPSSTASSSIPPASTLAVASKSHSGAVAAGITVSLAGLAIIAFIVFLLRRRHQRRQAERRVTWISGFVDGDVPDMNERSSIRSSWGTPHERLSFWARPSTDGHDPSPALPPVLPMPVHSPLIIQRPGSESPEIPENPFSDVEAAIQASPQPLQPMLTLPIRLSLISAGSGQDPFDDTHRTTEPINGFENKSSYELSEGHNTSAGHHGPSQANFPMPPPSTPSVKSVFALGSPSDLHPSKELLQTPTISFTFPDSPISPTFASSGTTSYPRRVSVKYDFRASQARSDEIHLDKGEEVNVMSVYEDGWAFVQKEKDNERGLAPLHCLDLAE